MKNIRHSLVSLLLVVTPLSASAAALPTFSLGRGDITAAVVERNNAPHMINHTMLVVTLTPQKEVEYAKFTAANIGKKTRFVVNGKTLSMPIISGAVTANASRKAQFEVASPEQAVAMAGKLLGKP